jgi:superfamily II DNA or RNA helicase
MKYFYENDMVCLVIVDSKSKQLKYLEENAKFASVTMGDMKADDRQVIYDKIKDGEIKSLISTVVKVGINIPNIDVIIRASGNISEVKVSQERGRGMRKTKDKDSFILIDFFDDDGMFNESDFGYAKKGFLRKHSEARVNYYKKIKNSNLYRVESRDIFELLNKNIKGD